MAQLRPILRRGIQGDPEQTLPLDRNAECIGGLQQAQRPRAHVVKPQLQLHKFLANPRAHPAGRAATDIQPLHQLFELTPIRGNIRPQSLGKFGYIGIGVRATEVREQFEAATEPAR